MRHENGFPLKTFGDNSAGDEWQHAKRQRLVISRSKEGVQAQVHHLASIYVKDLNQV